MSDGKKIVFDPFRRIQGPVPAKIFAEIDKNAGN
jgi:hypothetical protein